MAQATDQRWACSTAAGGHPSLRVLLPVACCLLVWWLCLCGQIGSHYHVCAVVNWFSEERERRGDREQEGNRSREDWLFCRWSTYCMHACSVVSDSATLWTVAHQAPLSLGFSRQKSWSGLSCPPPADLPNTGIKPTSPASRSRVFTPKPPGKPTDLYWLRPNQPTKERKAKIILFTQRLFIILDTILSASFHPWIKQGKTSSLMDKSSAEALQSLDTWDN